MTADLLSKMSERDRLRRRLAMLEAEIAAGCRSYSLATGRRVYLRPEQVRAELMREEAA